MDGRRAGEIRRVHCKLGLFSHVDGSALYEQGNTKIIASVYGPREASRRGDAEHDRAVVSCEYSVTSFSTGERKKRSKMDRRLRERSLALKQIFESVICTKLYPRSQISVFVQVVQSDGGDMAAAVNAASLALIDAGIPMSDFLTCCSAGFIDGTPILDLNFTEGNSHGPELTLAVCPNDKSVSYMQMDKKLPLEHLEKVVDLATDGCVKIYEILKAAVKKHSFGLLHARGSDLAAA